MPKIEITRTTYENFGNCVKMSNGTIELYVTVDVGPRVIHFSRVGMENVFFTDKEHKPLGEKFGLFNGDIYIPYGGHRLWISPEIMPRCYHPDNLPVTVTEVEGGVAFAAAVEEHNKIQKIITIYMSETGEGVTVLHTIKNVGVWEIELAPWCLTVLAPGGIGVMPQPSAKTGLLYNRNFSLWDYSEMNDERVYWGKDFITLRQIPGKKQPFKLGYNNVDGWGAYFNRGQAFFKFFEPEEGGMYPDNDCCYESFTNEFFLEAETLGELTLVPPGGEVSHVEEWELYEESAVPSSEESIHAVVGKYIE